MTGGIVCSATSGGITNTMVTRAFRQVGVPTPSLHIQPVHHTTLVNLKTDFYATGTKAFTKTVTLLGHHVTLRIHTDHFTFTFGDGHTLTTTEPGSPYPRLTDTHTYLRKGRVRVHLATTWAATYRIDRGTWHTVTGTITTTTPDQPLRITTATPVLTNPGNGDG
ncbi:MAG: hypothetical protein FWD95_01395 [Nocardioidaceae bacterium]|nr:hypothetical protein [Nocardioidaceae bacterium]